MLAHLNQDAIKYMVKHQLFSKDSNYSLFDPSGFIDCESCRLYKSQALPKNVSHSSVVQRIRDKDNNSEALSVPEDLQATSNNVVSSPLDMVHCDGLQFDLPNCVQAYEFIFIDDYTDFKVIYAVSSRADFITVLQAYQALAFFYHKTHIKVLRMDNAAEMSSEEVYDFCRFNGIHIQRCAPYEHHQNGKAERAVRTIEECALTMLHHANLSIPLFINYALANAVQLRNKCPTKNTKQLCTTPQELFTGRAPRIEDCHPIGEICYAYIRKEQRRLKYDPKSRKCIYLCEDYERKSHLVMDVSNRTVISTRDVRFPRVGASIISPSLISPLVNSSQESNSEEPSNVSDNYRSGSTSTGNSGQTTSQIPSVSTEDSPSRSELSITDLASLLARNYPSEASEGEVTAGPSTPTLTLEGRSDVSETTSTDLGFEVVETFEPLVDLPSSSSTERCESENAAFSDNRPQGPIVKTRRKNSRYFHPDFTTYNTSEKGEIQTPSTYHEAIASPQKSKWMQAIDEELDSLRRQDTWKLVPRTRDMFVVQSKWVFKLKTNEVGEITRYKARLVARGFPQTEGIDYEDTCSPVLQSSSRRFIFCLSAMSGMKSVQADVETAFLQSQMDKTVFLEAPLGLHDVPEGHVLLLLKAIYGLKQSPLLWFCTARQFFLNIGFAQCISDPCLFVLKNAMGTLILSIYVDDISLTSESKELIEWVLMQAKARFPIRDVQSLSWLVGIKIEKNCGYVRISQPAFIESLLEQFEVDRSQVCRIPMATNEYRFFKMMLKASQVDFELYMACI